jgi:hypothetical protein
MLNKSLSAIAAMGALPLWLCAQGDAAESFLDLRVGYTVVEDSYEGVRDDGVTESEVDQDWDNSHRAWALLLWCPSMHSYGGFLLGISGVAAFRDTNEDDSDADIEYDAYAAHLNLGYGVPIGEIFQVELIPFIGYGSAKLERVVPGNESTHDRETLIEWGANLNGVFTLGKHFQIGAQVGYLVSDSALEIREASGEEVDYDFKDGNFLFSGFLGYRF